MCLAVPGRVISINEGDPKMARISFGGAIKEICMDFVPEARVNDYVIVHAGFAINLLDEEEAQKTLEILSQFPDIE